MINVSNLTKKYFVNGECITALDSVNINIQKGEFCCIVGSSGSGKSTLLKLLAGIERPNGGTISINNNCIHKMTENELAKFRQNNIGFIFQAYNLLPYLTAIENVALPLLLKGVDKYKRLKLSKTLLCKLGLELRLNNMPCELSGGQQQRVGIARALITHPQIILADEPTGNLDTESSNQIMKLLIGLSRKKNITIIMVTHDSNIANQADRIITLNNGFILSDTINQSSLSSISQ